MGLDISIRDKNGVELAYWRDHHDLNDFILKTFSEKYCNTISLGEKDIINIMSAIANESHEDSDDFILCNLGNVLAHIMYHNRKDPNYKLNNLKLKH